MKEQSTSNSAIALILESPFPTLKDNTQDKSKGYIWPKSHERTGEKEKYMSARKQNETFVFYKQ